MQPVIDTTKAHSARVYDYYLGGKDHFAAEVNWYGGIGRTTGRGPG